MEQGETQGSGDGATPLVDATAKPLKELVYEEKKPLPPPASTPMQQGSWCKTEEEEKKEEERRGVWICSCKVQCKVKVMIVSIS